jgi:predicted dienelactone hydrolase
MLVRFVGGLWLSIVLVTVIRAAEVVEPLPPGPCAVACTNLELDVPADRPLEDYLLGKRGRHSCYVSGILKQPGDVLIAHAEVPSDKRVFAAAAGTRIPLVLLIAYPTPADNPRPDYMVPYTNTGDRIIPHMQRSGEKPIFADPTARYPVVFYSSGYNTHGLWDLGRIKFLASHGYIVVSIFHGDGRFGPFGSFRVRPLELRAAMDFLLAHPAFTAAIDHRRIGVSGSSMGGYTILASMGGQTTEPLISAADPRIKAGFALVPFVGAFWQHPFGSDFAGLKSVHTPFLAICAGNDHRAPAKNLEKALRLMSGTRSAFKLLGERHILTDTAWPDVETWETHFFNAWLKQDAEA